MTTSFAWSAVWIAFDHASAGEPHSVTVGSPSLGISSITAPEVTLFVSTAPALGTKTDVRSRHDANNMVMIFLSFICCLLLSFFLLFLFSVYDGRRYGHKQYGCSDIDQGGSVGEDRGGGRCGIIRLPDRVQDDSVALFACKVDHGRVLCVHLAHTVLLRVPADKGVVLA